MATRIYANCLNHARFIAFTNRATDTRYQFKQGQVLPPQFRYIACLVCAHCVLVWKIERGCSQRLFVELCSTAPPVYEQH